jgi:hypothetical protein
MPGDIGNYLLHAVDVAHESPRKEVLDNVASRTAIAGVAAALAAKHRAPHLRKTRGTDVTEIKARDLAESIARRQGGGEAGAQPRGVVGAASLPTWWTSSIPT